MKTLQAKPTGTKARSANASFFGKDAGKEQPGTTAEETPFFGKGATIQAKLTVGRPDDPYEQEADAVADQVVQKMSAEEPQRKTKENIQSKPITAPVQAKCSACDQEEQLQQKEEESQQEQMPGLMKKTAGDGHPEAPPEEQDDENKNIIRRKCSACSEEDTQVQRVKKTATGDTGTCIQRQCRECEEGDKVFLKPVRVTRPRHRKAAAGGNGSRESVIAAARSQLGKVRAKENDGSGKRVGAKYLLEYFHKAAPGVWPDSIIETAGAQMPSWCGIFSVWAHKQGGKDIGEWQMGRGVSAFGTLTPTTSPQPGDIGYIHKPYQHHCIVVKVEGGSVHSIDGNSGTFSEVIENTRPLSEFTGFFTAFGAGAGTQVQRKAEPEERIDKKESSTGRSVSSSVESTLASSKGQGAPLPAPLQQSMGSAMNADFSNVRIHTGSQAVQMSQDLNAQAFTHGNDIYFNEGKYDTESTSGQHLLAHELTHTVQQGASIQAKQAPDVQKEGLSTQEIRDNIFDIVDDWVEIEEEHTLAEEHDQAAYCRRVVLLLLWQDKSWITTDEDIELYETDCTVTALYEDDTLDEFSEGQREFILASTMAFPLTWSERIYDALYLEVDQESLDEEARKEWETVVSKSYGLADGIMEKGLPVSFDEALSLKEFDLGLKWAASEKDHPIVTYAKAGSAYIRKKWTSSFFVIWNAIAKEVADSVAEGTISVGSLSYFEFIDKKQKGLRELADKVAEAGDELTLEKLQQDTLELKDLAVVQGMASGLLALVPALMHWKQVRDLFDQERATADVLIATKDDKDKAFLAFRWAYENGYFGEMGARLWAGIKEHGWEIMAMLIGFIIVQFIPYLNVAVDAIVIITSGVGAVKSLLALKDTFSKVAKVQDVIGMQRASAMMAKSLTVDGITLLLDLLVVISAVKLIKMRAATIKGENPGLSDKEALDKALKEAGTKESKILTAAQQAESFLAKYKNSPTAQKVLAYAEGDMELAEKLMSIFGKPKLTERIKGIFNKDEASAAIRNIIQKQVPDAPEAIQTQIVKLIKAHPDILLTVRSTKETLAQLKKLKTVLDFEAVQALRKTVAGFNRVPYISASKESLLEFLDKIWEIRDKILAGETSSYKQYQRTTEIGKLVKKTAEQYLEEVYAIQKLRAPGSPYGPQGDAMTNFHHFYRVGYNVENATERAYLHLNPDYAPEMMKHVVLNIVDNPAFPGITGAKILGPIGSLDRPDTIVIFIDNAAAAEKVLESVNKVKASNPHFFKKATPPMTKEVGEGIGVAQEPIQPNPASRISFGQSRGAVIDEALEQTVKNNGTKDDFIRAVDEAMANPKSGINPADPHLNKPVPKTPPEVQPKLKTGGKNDRFEQEADAMADKVTKAMGNNAQPALTSATRQSHTQSTPAVQKQEAKTPATPAPAAAKFILADIDAPADGQLRKTEFLARLNRTVCAVTDEVLAGTPFTAQTCPYITQAFRRLARKTPAEIEALLYRYEGSLQAAENLQQLFELISIRVRAAVTAWLQTGDLSGVPAEIAAQIPENIRTMARISAKVAGVAGSIRSGISSAVSGTKGLLSDIGSLFFKTKAGHAPAPQSPGAVRQGLGEGKALESSSRSRMESAFGTDFSDVKVHTDSNAGSMAQDMNARAFTVGNHVAFGSGEYKPGTLAGDALMAHELAHVRQQQEGGAIQAKHDAGSSDALENDADHAAAGVMTKLWDPKGKLQKKGLKENSPALKSGLRLSRCGGDAPTSTDMEILNDSYTWSGDPFNINFNWHTWTESKAQNLDITLTYTGDHQADRQSIKMLYPYSGAEVIPAPVVLEKKGNGMKIDLFNNGSHIIRITDEVVEVKAWAPPLRRHVFHVYVNDTDLSAFADFIEVKSTNAIPSEMDKALSEAKPPAADKKIHDPVTALELARSRVDTLRTTSPASFWDILITQIDTDLKYLKDNKGKLSKEEELKRSTDADAFETASRECSDILIQLDQMKKKELYLEDIAEEAVGYVEAVQSRCHSALFRSYTNDDIAKGMRANAERALYALPYQISALYLKEGKGIEGVKNQLGPIRESLMEYRAKNGRAVNSSPIDNYLDVENRFSGKFSDKGIDKDIGKLRKDFANNAKGTLTEILNLTTHVQQYRGVYAVLLIYEQFIYFDDKIPWLTSDSETRTAVQNYRSKFSGYVGQLDAVMDIGNPVTPEAQSAVVSGVVGSFAQDVSTEEFSALLKQIETDFKQYETVKVVFKTIAIVAVAAATAGAAGAAMGAALEGAGIGGAVAFGAVTFAEALAFTATSRLVGPVIGMPSTTSFGEDLVTNWAMFGFMKRAAMFYESIGGALKAAGHMKAYNVAQFSGSKLAFSIGALQAFSMGHHFVKTGKGMTGGEFAESLFFNTILSSAMHFGRFAIQPLATKTEASVRELIMKTYSKQLAAVETERAALKTLLAEINVEKAKAPEKLPDALLRLRKLAESELALIMRAGKAKGLTGAELQKMAGEYVQKINEANLRLAQLGVDTGEAARPMFREVKPGIIAYEDGNLAKVKEVLESFYKEYGGTFEVKSDLMIGNMGAERVYYMPESKMLKTGLVASAISRTADAAGAFEYVKVRVSPDGQKGLESMKTELGGEQPVMDRLQQFENAGRNVEKILDNYISDAEIDSLSRAELQARIERSGDEKALEMFKEKSDKSKNDKGFKAALKGMKRGNGSLVEALREEKLRIEAKEAKDKALADLAEDMLLVMKEKGFFSDPRVQQMITNKDVSGLRGEIAEFLAREMAMKQKLDSGVPADQMEMISNVEIVEKVPGFSKIDAWKKANPTLAKETPKLREGDGQLWRSITEVDYMILKKPSGTGTLRTIIESGQVKSGSGDQHSEASGQHAKAQAGIDRMLSGDSNVQVFIRTAKTGILGENISTTVDFSTLRTADQPTIGPAGKGFDRSFDLKTDHFNNMAQKAIDNPADFSK